MEKTHRHLNSLLLAFFLASAFFTSPLLADSQEDAQKVQEQLQITQDIADGKLALNGPTSDTWLIAAWEFVRNNAVKFWDWLSTLVTSVLAEDFKAQDTNPVGAIVLLSILTLMTLSGAWAASIAQSRRHPRVKFFVIGFFTFFVGPYRMLLNLDIKGEKEALAKLAEEAAAKKAEKEERARKEQEGQINKGIVQPPAVSETGVVWDQNYFSSIQRKADGTPDGPWEVAYNGVHVRVLEILEVLPNLVAVRLINQEGNELRGRIPFAKIEQWDRAENQ